MGPIGIPELIFIFLIALLVFGPKKLPELGRNLGKALTEFRRASNDLKYAVEEEMRDLERQANETKRLATDAVSLEKLTSVDSHTDAPDTAADTPRLDEKPAHGEAKPA